MGEHDALEAFVADREELTTAEAGAWPAPTGMRNVDRLEGGRSSVSMRRYDARTPLAALGLLAASALAFSLLRRYAGSTALQPLDETRLLPCGASAAVDDVAERAGLPICTGVDEDAPGWPATEGGDDSPDRVGVERVDASAERSVQSVDALAALTLGQRLAEEGDLARAAAANQRAEPQKAPAGASNLGVRLRTRGTSSAHLRCMPGPAGSATPAGHSPSVACWQGTVTSSAPSRPSSAPTNEAMRAVH